MRNIMKELEKSELMEVDGGLFGWDDFLVGIAVGTFLAIISGWDDFEKGFKGEPYKAN
jgi:urea transporter